MSSVSPRFNVKAVSHIMAHHSVFSIFCTCVCFIISGALAQNLCRPFLEATSNLREVVIAKCTIYEEMINQQPFCHGNKFESRNCTEVWESFSDGFMHQPLCNVSMERYDNYITLTDHPVPTDKSLFWENVYPFVHRFSNKGAKYVTLSDTLTGYIGNMLQWCSDPLQGMLEPPSKCPAWEPTPSCHQSAQRAFWMAASKSFGLRASGEVTIMMDAENDPIFTNTSYFAEYELPFMSSKVTKATLLLLNKQPDKNRNRCDDASLGELANLLQAKNIPYECVENRRDMAELYCHDNPQSKVCSTLTPQTNSATYVTPSIVLASMILAWFI